MIDPTETAVLLISCPDRRGIVAAIAGCLSALEANILDADQHTDSTPEKPVFFQRIRVDLDEVRADRATFEREIAEEIGKLAAPNEGRLEISWSDERKRVAIFVSKQDHCLYDLLLRNRAAELNCDIPLVLSNHSDTKNVAEQFGAAFELLPITDANRATQETRELELLAEHRIDLVVLARYMQILSKKFIEGFPRSIINIHHSFLPAFRGGRPYHQAHERGVKLIGATAHYATPDLDEGPIIEQDVIRATHRDSVRDLSRKGRDVERLVLSRAVRWHLEDRVLVYGNKTVVFN